MSAENDGVTRRLVSLSRGLRYREIPSEALTVARHCLLDWFGVTLAGSREPLAEILRSQVAASDHGSEATVFGHDGRTTALSAALVNGATSHALDFDDTHLVMMGHPSVPVIPAVLALAEREDLDGKALLTALVAGVEVECRLGALTSPHHYAVGFHSTGTLGTFGAAAAASRLLELGEEESLHALGLAGTQAAGLKSGFGTMAKPLHAGKAAADGLLSALLAAGGYTSNPAIVETEQGFAATHHGGEPTVGDLDPWDGRFLIRDTLFKYHAACYLTHSSIEGALQLRRDAGLRPEEIRTVELRVAPSSLKVCNILEPATGLEGKFSLRATAAMTLLGDDTADLRSYSDERMSSPELVSLRDRVRIEPVRGTANTDTEVVVETTDGKRHNTSVDVGTPATDLAEQERRLQQKYLVLAQPVLGEERARQLADAVDRVASLKVRDLVALATPLDSASARAPRSVQTA